MLWDARPNLRPISMANELKAFCELQSVEVTSDFNEFGNRPIVELTNSTRFSAKNDVRFPFVFMKQGYFRCETMSH